MNKINMFLIILIFSNMGTFIGVNYYNYSKEQPALIEKVKTLKNEAAVEGNEELEIVLTSYVGCYYTGKEKEKELARICAYYSLIQLKEFKDSIEIEIQKNSVKLNAESLGFTRDPKKDNSSENYYPAFYYPDGEHIVLKGSITDDFITKEIVDLPFETLEIIKNPNLITGKCMRCGKFVTKFVQTYPDTIVIWKENK